MDPFDSDGDEEYVVKLDALATQISNQRDVTREGEMDACTIISLVPTLGVTPSPMEGASCCWVPGGMLLFGGYAPDYKAEVRETWMLEFETTTWKQITWKDDEAPCARSGHVGAMISDSRMLIFGGFSKSNYLGDTWIFNIRSETWQPVISNDQPPPRRDGACCCVGGKVFLHGGMGSEGPLNDFWMFEGNAWIRIETSSGPRPPAIYDHQLSPRRDCEVWLTGGVDGGQPSGFVWKYSIVEAVWVGDGNASSGLQPRSRHRTVFLNDLLLVVGGCTTSPNEYATPAIQMLDMRDGHWYTLKVEEYDVDNTLLTEFPRSQLHTRSARRDFTMLSVSPTKAWIWGGRYLDGYCSPAVWSIQVKAIESSPHASIASPLRPAMRSPSFLLPNDSDEACGSDDNSFLVALADRLLSKDSQHMQPIGLAVGGDGDGVERASSGASNSSHGSVTDTSYLSISDAFAETVTHTDHIDHIDHDHSKNNLTLTSNPSTIEGVVVHPDININIHVTEGDGDAMNRYAVSVTNASSVDSTDANNNYNNNSNNNNKNNNNTSTNNIDNNNNNNSNNTNCNNNTVSFTDNEPDANTKDNSNNNNNNNIADDDNTNNNNNNTDTDGYTDNDSSDDSNSTCDGTSNNNSNNNNDNNNDNNNNNNNNSNDTNNTANNNTTDNSTNNNDTTNDVIIHTNNNNNHDNNDNNATRYHSTSTTTSSYDGSTLTSSTTSSRWCTDRSGAVLSTALTGALNDLSPLQLETPTNSGLPSATSTATSSMEVDVDTSSLDTVVGPPTNARHSLLNNNNNNNDNDNDDNANGKRTPQPNNKLDSALQWRQMSGHLNKTRMDWSLGGKLGQGAAGIVYKCMDRQSGDFFAAKKLNMADVGQVQMEKLAKEVTMLKDLKQPHIVSYRGYDILDDNLYIFMDYCPGGDLQSVLKSFGGLSLNLTRRYSGQICTGLNYLHGKQTLHRDVKAANVLLTISGQAKLSDFGLAKLINDASISNGMKTRSVVGSPYWMAPEVIVGRGSRPNGASDVWSLGATVYEMAASKPPLGHLEPMAALFHVGSQRELGLGGGHNMLGLHGLDFVRLCLNYTVDDRPSCSDLLQHAFLQTPNQP